MPEPPTNAPLPLPAPAGLLPLKWTVLRDGDRVFFALDAKGYENLSRNTSELTRWAHEAMYNMEQCRQ